MRHLIALAMVLLGFGGVLLSQAASPAQAAGPHAALLEIDETILPSTARFLDRGIDKAIDDGATILIVTLDTSGGLLDSTRDMVGSILESGIPVVVYVSPQGARAASAGTFITAAAHVAAMSSVSNIGAASPVGAGGDLPPTLESKAKQDAAADIRSIAEARGRNIEALEATVLEAKSYSASEALQENIVDLIAADLADLLSQLDGRTVCLGAGCTVNEGLHEGGALVLLKTEGLETIDIEKTVLENFLGFLGNPTVAFLLLALGAIGIFIEFYIGTGLIMPGVAGAIFLALAFVAMGQLPVNWVGAALLAVSIFLFYIEAQAPGTTIFGASGAIAFALGGLLLFGGFTLPGFTPEPIEAPSLHVNPWVVGAVTAGLTATVVLFLKSIAAARTAGTSAPTTPTSLVGQMGIVTAALAPEGAVHLRGEEWHAVSDSGEPIAEGEEVLVSSSAGLTLKVFKSPLPHEDADEGSPEVEPA